jgi:16S rRNA (cytosine967-C5)-methyltransferase
MTPGARYQAVLEVLSEVCDRTSGVPRPLEAVCADFFRKRRYIGSKDRSAIASFVYGVARSWAQILFYGASQGRDLSHFWKGRAPEGSARFALLTYLAGVQKIPLRDIELLWSGDLYHPESLTASEKRWLKGPFPADTSLPRWVQAGVSDAWFACFERQFGEEAFAVLTGLSESAPTDLRVNLLKTNRLQVMERLKLRGIENAQTPYSPWGIRLTARHALTGLPEFVEGLFEIQDEGSQVMASLLSARQGDRVLDLCAGAGGKTLALGMMMENRGQIWATDVAKWRLERTRVRAKRAGLFNVQYRALEGLEDSWLVKHEGYFDRVLLDVPCSGTGTWRRHPEQKWHCDPSFLEPLLKQQQDILTLGARMVRKGGRLLYGTCSLLELENQKQVHLFLEAHPDFKIRPHGAPRSEGPSYIADLQSQGLPDKPLPLTPEGFLVMRPDQTGTDGFFAACLEKI